MDYKNHDDVLRQLREYGLLVDGPLVLARGDKSERCHIDGGDSEKRGWYRLHEWPMSNGDRMIVGTYGYFQGDNPNTQKVVLTKRCTDCAREIALAEKVCPGCGSKQFKAHELSDEQKAAIREKQAQDKKRAEFERRAEIDRAAQWAGDVWRHCRDIEPGDHDYLSRKKLAGTGGARVFESNDGLNLVGADADDYKYLAQFHGCLVIPMMDAAGKVYGLQFIDDRKRENHKTRIAKTGRDKNYWPRGLSKDSHYHQIGGTPGRVCLIAEGFATALSLHNATNHTVIVAFDAGNLPKVAKAIKATYKKTRQLICADDDWLQKCKSCGKYTPVAASNCQHCQNPHGTANAGQQRAQEAALLVDGGWISPKFQAEKPVDRKGPTDFNDLHALEGLTPVRTQIEAALSAMGIDPAPQPAVSKRSAGSGSQGEGERRDAKSVIDLDTIIDRFVPIDDGTGDYVFDYWTNKIVKRAQMIALLPAGVRGDDIKRHPLWIQRGAFYIDQVGFDPTGKDHKIKLNTWRGFEMTPIEGDCPMIMDLAAYLCSAESNSHQALDFMLDSMAHQIQKPGVKLHSAIIMQGPQGTGKSTFFNLMMQIFGSYAKKLNQRALEDKFNSDWAEALFIQCEEIAASSEVWHVKGEVKDLITGEYHRKNEKNIAASTVKNRMNFVILSNETIPMPLERDDRRFLVIRTPPAASRAFYHAVHAEIEDGGVERFMYQLKNRDISNFHPKSTPPMTDSKRRLIAASSPSEQVFIEEWISGQIEFANKRLPVCPCTGTQLHGAYARWARQSLVSRPRDLNQFISFLHGLDGWSAAKSCATFEDLHSTVKKNRKMVIPSDEAFSKALLSGAETVERSTNTLQRWLTEGYCAFGAILDHQ